MCNYKRLKKSPSSRTFKLRGHPQVLTSVWRIAIRAPKKPNSGKRRVAKCKVSHVKRKDRVTVRLTGYNFFPRRFGRVLICGGRANDTPGVTYRGIRGHQDFYGHMNKTRSRSFYGVKRLKETVTYIPRWLRNEGVFTLKDFMSTQAFGRVN